MAKITKKSLTRGTELVPDHLASLTDAANVLNNANVDTENMETPYAPFTVGWSIPWLESKFFNDNDTQGNKPFYTAFCLPPVQDNFATTGELTSNNDLPILESISFSFDQRDAPAGVLSHWYGTSKANKDASSHLATDTTHYQITANHSQFEPNPFEGFLAYNRIDGLDIKIAIYEKKQTFFDTRETVSALTIDTSSGVASVTISATGRNGARITTTASHGLVTGDRVRITGGQTTPDTINGEWEITEVAGQTNQFEIQADVSSTHTDIGTVTPITRHGNATVSVENEVYSTLLPASAIATSGGNPVLIEGLNIPFNPYHTYILAIYAPGLHDDRNVHVSDPRAPLQTHVVGYADGGGTDETAVVGSLDGTGEISYRLNEHLALVSVWANLNFKMKLLSRELQDTNSVAVQNMPKHKGTKTNQDISTAAPSVSADIKADSETTSVSTRIQNVDRPIMDKLRGGYDSFSKTYPYEHIANDAAYDVITVPLMQGFEFNQLTPLTFAKSQYQTITGAPVAHVDRRLIPITSPLTIEHITACLNFTGTKVMQRTALATRSGAGRDGSTTSDPYNVIDQDTSSTRAYYTQARFPQPRGFSSLFTYQIGVALVTGNAADNFNYQQIAYVEYDPAREQISRYTSPFLIDAVDMELDAMLPSPTDSSWYTASTTDPPKDNQYRKFFEQALVSVPIQQYDTANTGAGYWGKFDSDQTDDNEMQRGTQGREFFVGESYDSLFGLKGYIPITSITAATERIVTTVAHGLKPDDLVYFTDTQGPNALLEDKYYLVLRVYTSTTFVVKNLDGTAVNITADSTSGGHVHSLGSMWEVDTLHTISATVDSTNLVRTAAEHGLTSDDVGRLVLISGTGDTNIDDVYQEIHTVPTSTSIQLRLAGDSSLLNLGADTSAGGVLRVFTQKYPRSFVGSNLTKANAVAAANQGVFPVRSQGQEQYIEVRMAVVPKPAVYTYRLSADRAGSTDAYVEISGDKTEEIFEDDIIKVAGSLDGEIDDKIWRVTSVSTVSDGGGGYHTRLHIASPYMDRTGTFANLDLNSSTDEEDGSFVYNFGNYRDILVGYGGNFLYLTCRKHLRA